MRWPKQSVVPSRTAMSRKVARPATAGREAPRRPAAIRAAARAAARAATWAAARAAPKRLGRAAAFATALFAALSHTGAATAQSLIRDSEIERTLSMMTTPVFEAANLERGEIRVFILQDRSLNAFVTPTRSMFLHTGLLRTLETPEELMGVMAHETGHVTGGHIVRRIAAAESAQTQAIFATLLGLAAVAAGAGSGGLAVIAGGQSVATRSLLRFTRGQESSADQAALTYLTRANVDPSGMLRVLERLEQQQSIFLDNVDQYALTHPLSRARIQALEQGVQKSPALGMRVSDEIIYWHTRMRAKLDGFLSRPGQGSLVSYGDREFDLYREAINLHRIPAPDRAIATIDELIALRPNDPYYWELKGQIMSESGYGPAAIEPYRRAVELAPDAPLISAGLGEALLTANTPEADAEALEVLSRAAVADPFDAGLRRPLAIAYARSGQDGLAAVVTAERLALSGNMRDAVRQAERAKKLLPVGSPGYRRAEDIVSLSPN